MNTLALRSGAALVLALVLYVAAGELVQAWVGLHIDAWRARPAFGNETDRGEWLRVANAVEGATQIWPWKASFHHQNARVQLHALRGNFRRPPDIGESMLASVDRAAAMGAVSGELLLLETRGCLLVGDYTGVEDAVLKLRQVSPYGRTYWQRLRLMLTQAAAQDSALDQVAADVSAYYENWLLPNGRDLRHGDGRGKHHRRMPAPAVPATPATVPVPG